MFHEALETWRRVQGEEDAKTLRAMHNLALYFDRHGRYEESESLFREIVAIRLRISDYEDRETLKVVHVLCEVLLKQDKTEEAEPLITEALSISRRVLEHDDALTAVLQTAFGECLLAQERFDEAEPQLLRGYEQIKATLGESHRRTERAIQALVELYDALGESQEADKWRAKSLKSER